MHFGTEKLSTQCIAMRKKTQDEEITIGIIK
jgi:hypothetical protein